jgi:D-sedoheptulose 7-phosphate isomerase
MTNPVSPVGGNMSLNARMAAFASVMAAVHVTSDTGAPMEVEAALEAIVGELRSLRARHGSLYLAGNGGSAAVAGHAVTDFLNVGRLRASTLHDSSLLTCMANDYGYENAFARTLSTLAQPNDTLIVISSSGRSANVTNASARMKAIGGRVFTLSGFAAANPLRSLGHVNLWIDSSDYGMVEIGHQFLLHNISDRMLSDFPK